MISFARFRFVLTMAPVAGPTAAVTRLMAAVACLMALVPCLVVLIGPAGWLHPFVAMAQEAAPLPTIPDASSIIHEIDLNVPIETVWNAFTTDEGFKALGVAKARVDLRVGGKILSHYGPDGELGDEGTIENTILAFEPLRMIAFKISKPPKDFPFMNAYATTWSVATLTDLGEGRTHLRFAMLGFTGDPESQKMRAFFEQGNAWVMQHLKQVLEGDVPEEVPMPTPDSFAAAPSDSLAPILLDTIVNAPAAEVWKLWTTSDGMRSFLTEANVELRIGGPFELYFDPEAPQGSRGSEGCVILSYDPGHMLSFSWNAPPKFAHARTRYTWVVVYVDPYGPHQSKVTLRHLGFAEQATVDADFAGEWAQVRAYFQRAWPMVLDALRKHFESSEG